MVESLKAVALGCALLLGSTVVVDAQPAVIADGSSAPLLLEEARTQVGFRGLIGFPLGKFDDHVGLSGGIDGAFTYRLGDGPFRVGGGMNALWYIIERRRAPLSSTIPDVFVDVTTRSGVLTSYGLLRVQPIQGRVRPYVDGLFGFNWVFTQTAVDLDETPFDVLGPSTVNSSDFALAYGAGAGTMVGLARWSQARLALDVGVRYIFGGEARYLTRNPDVPFETVADLDVNRSRTDVAEAVIGLAVDF